MRRLLICLALTWPVFCFAQDESSSGAIGSNATYELGFNIGELLPNQIKGVTELMGLGGARAAFRLAPLSYVETGLLFGNGEGQRWRNGHVGIRGDFPVQNLVGIAYVGADATVYDSTGYAERVIFGGHAGGGVQAHVMGSCWFRGDMKFTFSPGTSLYFGFGFTWRLGTGTNGA